MFLNSIFMRLTLPFWLGARAGSEWLLSGAPISPLAGYEHLMPAITVPPEVVQAAAMVVTVHGISGNLVLDRVVVLREPLNTLNDESDSESESGTTGFLRRALAQMAYEGDGTHYRILSRHAGRDATLMDLMEMIEAADPSLKPEFQKLTFGERLLQHNTYFRPGLQCTDFTGVSQTLDRVFPELGDPAAASEGPGPLEVILTVARDRVAVRLRAFRLGERLQRADPGAPRTFSVDLARSMQEPEAVSIWDILTLLEHLVASCPSVFHRQVPGLLYSVSRVYMKSEEKEAQNGLAGKALRIANELLNGLRANGPMAGQEQIDDRDVWPPLRQILHESCRSSMSSDVRTYGVEDVGGVVGGHRAGMVEVGRSVPWWLPVDFLQNVIKLLEDNVPESSREAARAVGRELQAFEATRPSFEREIKYHELAHKMAALIPETSPRLTRCGGYHQIHFENDQV